MNIPLIRALESRRQVIIEAWYASQFNDQIIQRYRISGLGSDDRSWIRPFILHPLLNLLIEYLRSGEERYLVVYQDERLRYAPHLAPPEKRAEFFQSVIPNDEAALLDAVTQEWRVPLQKALKELHGPLLEHPSKTNPPVHLLCIGNCTMGETRIFLSHRARQNGIPLDTRLLYLNSTANSGLLSCEAIEFIENNKVDLIATGFLSFGAIPVFMALLQEADKLSDMQIEKRVAGIMALIRDFIDNLRRHTSVPILIHEAGGLPLSRLRRCIPFLPPLSRGRRKVLEHMNRAVHDLVAGVPKCVLIRETVVTKREGYRTCCKTLIPDRVAGKGLFRPSVFGSFMCDLYLPLLKAYHRLRKAKLLLVDLDNTLWKGVMAEGPVVHYRNRQELLRQLKNAGMLLVAVSKNSHENIRWDEMVLKPEDFVLLKINWNLKAQSIQEAASELNLGMDSFVLLDDNPVEIDLVRQTLPDVVGLDSLKDETWNMLEMLFLFPNTQDTEESRTRTEMYRAQVARQKSLTGELDYPEMMRSLNLRVKFGRSNMKDLDRLVELINRTNQFNTTTIRYSRTELEKHLADPSIRVYIAELEDKFGKLGIVAAAVVKRQGEEHVIESFVMSCRAMGFGLENLMLRKIVEAEGKEAKKIVGRYIRSDRNLPAAALFKNNRFEPVNETEWLLSSSDAVSGAPEWFTVAER